MSSTSETARCEAAASRREMGNRPWEEAKFLAAVIRLVAVAETLVLTLWICCALSL